MCEKKEDLQKRISYLEGKLSEMEQVNASYVKQTDIMLQAIRDLSGLYQQMMQQVTQMSNAQTLLEVNQNITKARCDNLRYELLDPRLNREEYPFPMIRSAEETIEEIIHGRKSIARFGDGEFSQIVKKVRQKFQRLDDNLGVRLEEVLHSHHPNLLIAIANNYGTLQAHTDFAADAIRFYMVAGETRKQHMELLEHDRVYYDAYVLRPYVMYKDNMTDAPRERFERLKKIWENRAVILVEGAQTRAGVGNDLFAGAREVKRILAPATSSFDRYDDILKAALKHAGDDTLFLIAMGPSAGVLAYDLTVEGYQALDIGHLDLEYEWFLAGKGERTNVPCKYNNETEGGNEVEELHDPVYESQIIEDCSI